jgi:hypothetical protein
VTGRLINSDCKKLQVSRPYQCRQALQRTITAAKAGPGFEHFRCFLVIPTRRAAMDKDSDREDSKRSSNNPEDWLQTNLIL